MLDTLLNKIPTFRLVLDFIWYWIYELHFKKSYITNLTYVVIFRELSMMHMDSLSTFKQENPQYIFPALYKELFSIDAQQDLLT